MTSLDDVVSGSVEDGASGVEEAVSGRGSGAGSGGGSETVPVSVDVGSGSVEDDASDVEDAASGSVLEVDTSDGISSWISGCCETIVRLTSSVKKS